MSKHIWLPGVAGNKTSTPDNAAFTPTTSIELFFRGAMQWDSTAFGSLFTHYDGSDNGIIFRSQDNPILVLFLGDGSANPIVGDDPGLSDGELAWVRVLCVLNDGGNTVTNFYKSSDNVNDPAAVSSWTGIGSDSQAAITVNNAASTLEVGDRALSPSPSTGKVYRAQVKIDGVIQFDADFTDESTYNADKTELTEKSSNAATVTLNGDSWVFVNPVTSGVLAGAEAVWKTVGQPLAYGPNLVNPLADLSGNNHHAVLGSAVGADTNDPKALDYDEQYLYLPGVSGNYASAPDYAAARITGDLDLRALVALDDWTPADNMAFVDKYSFGQRAYRFFMTSGSDGFLQLQITDDGATSITSYVANDQVTLVAEEKWWVRVTLDVDNGAADSDCKFWKSANGIDWTQVGATQQSGSTESIYAGTDNIEIGSDNGGVGFLLQGKLYRAQIYDGIAGTLVFDADFTDKTNVVEPFATFTESSAQAATVTINRAATGVKAAVVDRNMFLLGTDDYFEVADAAGLNFVLTDSFTVMFVGRIYDSGDGTKIIFMSKAVAIGYDLQRPFGSTKLGFRIVHTAGGGVDIKVDSAAFTLVDGEIFQGAGVRNVVSDNIISYVDAVASTPVTDTTTASLTSAAVLRLGSGSGGGNYFDGEFMGAAIFREALSEADIVIAGRELLSATTGAIQAYHYEHHLRA